MIGPYKNSLAYNELMELGRKYDKIRHILNQEFGLTECPHCHTIHTNKWIGRCREREKPMIDHNNSEFVKRNNELKEQFGVK